MDLSDSAGYCVAFVGALAHGSYGVPVKATKDVDVHPLILQSYKTVVLAFMSCVVIPILTRTMAASNNNNDDQNNSIRFTPFGILSGFLWVSGGACGIYGIRQAGMAIAVGTWASLMVCVNFTWGILIFQEPVYSFVESCMAFGLLLVGLVGMSKYSAKTATPSSDKTTPKNSTLLTENGDDDHNISNSSIPESSTWEVEMRSTSTNSESRSGKAGGSKTTSTRRKPNRGSTTRDNNNNNSSGTIPAAEEFEDEDTSLTTSLLKKVNAVVYGDVEPNVDHDDYRHKKFSYSHLNLLAIWYRFIALVPSAFASLTPRQAGICMAAMNGILGGCSLVPLHYAKQQGFAGLTYIPSFGLGSFIANIGLWSMYFAWTYYQQKQLHEQQQQQQQQQQDKEMQASNTTTTSSSVWKSSMDLMPSFYWSKLWKRGLLAGLLLSIGMICSILATGALGQGVGNSLVQLKILISGLWGIFYYKEIQNKRSIQLWFLSACICVSGILGLSYQRLMATQYDDGAAAVVVATTATAAASTTAAAIASVTQTILPQAGMVTAIPIPDAAIDAPQTSVMIDTPIEDLPNTQVLEGQ